MESAAAEPTEGIDSQTAQEAETTERPEQDIATTSDTAEEKADDGIAPATAISPSASNAVAIAEQETQNQSPTNASDGDIVHTGERGNSQPASQSLQIEEESKVTKAETAGNLEEETQDEDKEVVASSPDQNKPPLLEQNNETSSVNADQSNEGVTKENAEQAPLSDKQQSASEDGDEFHLHKTPNDSLYVDLSVVEKLHSNTSSKAMVKAMMSHSHTKHQIDIGDSFEQESIVEHDAGGVCLPNTADNAPSTFKTPKKAAASFAGPASRSKTASQSGVTPSRLMAKTKLAVQKDDVRALSALSAHRLVHLREQATEQLDLVRQAAEKNRTKLQQMHQVTTDGSIEQAADAFIKPILQVAARVRKEYVKHHREGILKAEQHNQRRQSLLDEFESSLVASIKNIEQKVEEISNDLGVDSSNVSDAGSQISSISTAYSSSLVHALASQAPANLPVVGMHLVVPLETKINARIREHANEVAKFPWKNPENVVSSAPLNELAKSLDAAIQIHSVANSMDMAAALSKNKPQQAARKGLRLSASNMHRMKQQEKQIMTPSSSGLPPSLASCERQETPGKSASEQSVRPWSATGDSDKHEPVAHLVAVVNGDARKQQSSSAAHSVGQRPGTSPATVKSNYLSSSQENSLEESSSLGNIAPRPTTATALFNEYTSFIEKNKTKDVRCLLSAHRELPKDSLSQRVVDRMESGQKSKLSRKQREEKVKRRIHQSNQKSSFSSYSRPASRGSPLQNTSPHEKPSADNMEDSLARLSRDMQLQLDSSSKRFPWEASVPTLSGVGSASKKNRRMSMSEQIASEREQLQKKESLLRNPLFKNKVCCLCNENFVEATNHNAACRWHSGKRYYDEGAWSCCGAKSGEMARGCRISKHSERFTSELLRHSEVVIKAKTAMKDSIQKPNSKQTALPFA